MRGQSFRCHSKLPRCVLWGLGYFHCTAQAPGSSTVLAEPGAFLRPTQYFTFAPRYGWRSLNQL
jgi:hypothetical protein